MKKYILTFGIILLLVLSGCSNTNTNNDNITPTTGVKQITISTDGSFDLKDCQLRGLENKVIMIESKYCGHCKAALPIFKEAAKEKGVEPIILDISDNLQMAKMHSYGVEAQYTPTFIFGCNYFVGAKTKEEYLKLFDEFLK